MKNKLNLILLLLIFPFVVHSQKKIFGVVKDSLGFVEFANVVLYDTDKKIISGTTTNKNGIFELTTSKVDCELMISYIGYVSLTKKVTIKEDTNIGEIFIFRDKDLIKQVEILVRKPRIIQKVDRIEFNIENSVLTDGSLWNVISKSPGIVTSNNGDIQMFGKNNVLIYIDNKPIRLGGEELMNMLESMRASNISSLEIIDTPPSNYDAQGGGVINIKTKRKNDLGINGSINSQAKFSIFPKFNNGFSLNYLKRKVGIYSTYNYGSGTNNGRKERETNYFQQSDLISIWDENTNIKSRDNTHNFRLVIDLALTKRSSLSFTSYGNIPDSDRRTITNTDILNVSNSSNDFLNTLNNTLSTSENISNSLFYEFKIDKRDRLNIEIENTNYNSKSNEKVITDGSNFFATDDFRSDSKQKINITSAKIDYVNIISASKIEMGIKAAFTDSENNLNYFNINGSAETFDSLRSNDFLYSENTYAAYFSYARNFEKISIKLGLRGEFTETEGDSKTLNQVNEFDYFRLFPTFYITYNLRKRSSLRFAYGRRISRPNFGLLNPFRFYYSPFSFIEGNPFLQPSFTDNFSFTYSYRGKHFFKYYFNYTDNPFTQISFQDGENETYRYFAVNLNNNLSTGLSVFSKIDMKKWWILNLQWNSYYKRNSFISQQNTTINNSNWNLDIFITNNFYVSEKTSLELFTRYLSPKIQGAFELKSRHEVSFGVSHKILQNRARLSIYVGDIFNGSDFNLETRYEDQDQVFFDDRENQFLRFGFSYRFGNSKRNKESQRRDDIQNEKERI
ncbi:outer membrane receptor protein involved in Fe transport [Kordia periserrulae]|uniref:Outer membrane receptor protein involved in Fe transport n=1 Tax=Kordia periserrulae TaxID=701523 RepID=A0A2T6C487_9FLAO|nr:outer membrane beta-barrel protein [Kordia periserrulae]PTX63141.1 outer membrane receptor protein involved in Fe transport [Kordia periserrulae]